MCKLIKESKIRSLKIGRYIKINKKKIYFKQITIKGGHKLSKCYINIKSVLKKANNLLKKIILLTTNFSIIT